MKNNLVIVESPAKAKTLSKILGKGYTIKASLGHVRDLPKSRMGVDIENNFEPKYVVARAKNKTVKSLRTPPRQPLPSIWRLTPTEGKPLHGIF